MKLVVQRVKNAKVEVEAKITGQIEQGFLVLLGVTHKDTKEEVEYLVKKLCNLRVFTDENDKMNLSLKEVEEAPVLKEDISLESIDEKIMSIDDFLKQIDD